MSNKNSKSELVLEDIRSNYPDISCVVQDNPTKVPEPSKNDSVQQSNAQKVTFIQTKIPSNQSVVGKLNSSANSVQKIPQSVGDRKVPPYVNTLPLDPVRVPKVHPQKMIPKATQKQVTEKVIVTTESTISSIAFNNKIPSAEFKKSTSIPQIVRSSSQTPIKSVNKQIVNDKPSAPSTAVASDEMKSNDTNESTNKNTADKVSLMIQSKSPLMSRTTDVFEKNIQSNVLSVTPRPTLNTQSPKTIPSKDKTNSTDSSPKSVTTPLSISKSTPSKPVLTTDSLCKNISKMVSVQCADSSSKPGRIVSANTSPKSDTTTKNIPKATNSNEAAAKISNKIYIAVTSTESSNKTEEKNSTVKNANSRSVSPATTPSTVKSASKSPTTTLSAPSTPKTQAESFAIPSSPSLPNVPSHISNNKNVTLTLTQTSGNLQLSSLSEIENNKDIREALNSGSTASIGENVTISSAGSGYYVIQAASTKVRNVSSETTIETITKQPSSSSAALTRNKNGNSNDSVQSSKSESNSGPSTPSSQSAGEARNTMQEAAFSTSHDLDEVENPNPKSSKKKVEEPVECLTISSDEEEAEPDHFVSSLSDTSDVSVSIMSKEPQIGRDDDHGTDGEKYEREVETLLETTSGDGFTNLACRTVRIGSYKVVPQENVTLSKYGLKIVVPPLNKPNESVSLKIPIHDIVKVLAHFGRSLPVIFYYVTNQVGARVRNLLKMTDSRDCYFDPASEEESHRRITLLPEKFTEDDKINIGDLYLQRDVLDELTHNEANQLLVKSAPREVQKGLKQVPPNPVQTIMVFPPPPAKGGISINTEDYSCLAEDVFLNDVIIDFYLKYLFHKRLSDEDRQKTHIFSSFFYKRLTDKTTPVPASLQNSKSGDSAARAAEIRHHRVKTWTKNIDIFSKDYIVIPLNENQHWFLAIICFPGLTGPVRYSDNTPIDVDSSKKDKDENASNADNEASSSSQTMTIGSTTITPLRIENSYTVCDDDDDAENRDEADGADEDVNIYTSSDDSDDDYSESEETETGEIRIKPKSADREPIKQPCILIFDSLAGASRARIIATLREYLHVEYKMKHGGEERDFTKNVVKGACPRVPQQTNYTDCGLYVLQYVESFFENKITDYHIPIKMLRYWFSPHTVSNKRYEIQQLLLQLMSEQNINIRSLHLPELKLSPRHPYYDSEEMEEYGDDDELYDEAHMEHGYGYEELDQIEEHDARARAMLEDDVDESEYIDEDEEIVGEDGKYHYSIYDSADEDSRSEELSDDDIYKDIDINVVEATRRNRRTIYHVRTKSDGDEETIHEEEEEIEEDDREDDQREQFTNERLVSLNNEDVTISRMPATAKEDGDTQSRRLAELKAARPLKKSHHEVSLEKTAEGCTPVKKFRSN